MEALGFFGLGFWGVGDFGFFGFKGLASRFWVLRFSGSRVFWDVGSLGIWGVLGMWGFSGFRF